MSRTALLDAPASGAELISAVAAESNEELVAAMDELRREIAAREAEFLARLGEVSRRQAFRADGATSAEAWTAGRYGFSSATARTYARLGEKAWDVPHLLGSLLAGSISLDKVRAVVDVATPENDRELRDQALECSVPGLVEVARTIAARRSSREPGPPDRQCVGYVRFNDDRRTMSAQLPPDAYAELRSRVDAEVKAADKTEEKAAAQGADGETPLDQRNCDALLRLVRSSSGRGGASSFTVVAHTALSNLVDGAGETSALAGELEHAGLIDIETVKRIACGATVIVGVDDDVGRTMYEGRAVRLATKTQRREVMRRDRSCRFPGCRNVMFAEVHHVIPWEPGGPTDLENLVLQCEYHHRLVHSNGWSMTGNANEALTIVNPSGDVVTSRPSPIWTRVTDGGAGRAGAPG